MDLDSDDENVVEEDFYSFLNVPKEATREEINNAYRRLSRMYHPDKHVDPELKTKAENLFNKTKKLMKFYLILTGGLFMTLWE
jgi:DnaJ family protein C protein 11